MNISKYNGAGKIHSSLEGFTSEERLGLLLGMTTEYHLFFGLLILKPKENKAVDFSSYQDLTKEEILEFKKIAKSVYGVDLSFEEAREQGSKLIAAFDLVLDYGKSIDYDEQL